MTSLLKFVRQEFVGGGKIILGQFLHGKTGKYAGNFTSLVNKSQRFYVDMLLRYRGY